ncbi:MAG: hypothetical protein JRJ49_03480 [Deltaproteobacteria bacterium]|nr:hypothetical protein [Deltaproteobacteria bacterium]
MSDNISLPWAQAIKNNWILMIIAISEAVCILLLSIAIIVITPLKTIEPIYVEFSSSGNNFVKIAKANENIQNNDLLLSYFLRRYVIDRETVDKTTEPIRYQRIGASSTKDLYAQFQAIYGNKETSLYYKKGFKRAVAIIRDNKLAKGIHQIEIETTDTDQFNNIKKADWIITIKYKFVEQKNIAFDDRLLNPAGLLIKEYTITARKKSSQKN